MNLRAASPSASRRGRAAGVEVCPTRERRSYLQPTERSRLCTNGFNRKVCAAIAMRLLTRCDISPNSKTLTLTYGRQWDCYTTWTTNATPTRSGARPKDTRSSAWHGYAITVGTKKFVMQFFPTLIIPV